MGDQLLHLPPARGPIAPWFPACQNPPQETPDGPAIHARGNRLPRRDCAVEVAHFIAKVISSRANRSSIVRLLCTSTGVRPSGNRASCPREVKESIAIFHTVARFNHRAHHASFTQVTASTPRIHLECINAPSLSLTNTTFSSHARVFDNCCICTRAGTGGADRTHNPDLAGRMDRIVTLREGRVIPHNP